MGFWIALQFLTIIPVPFNRAPKPEDIGSAMPYFPLIGLLAGAILYLANWGLAEVFPQAVACALVLAIWIILSGAIHLDGLMDTCDGLKGHTPDRRLEIMADSHVGAFGIVGAIIVIIVKYSGLISLGDTWDLEALLLTPLLGGWVLVLLIFVFPYARQNGGLGQHYKSGASIRRFIIASIIMLAGCLVLTDWRGFIIAAVVSLCALAIGCYFKSRLGGLTGDVYGATREITEAVMLILIPELAGIC